MCYIISISFQIAGSLLLLINTFSTKRKNVLYRFGRSNFTNLNNNTKQIYYDEEQFKGMFKDAYLAKGSFLLIVLGYFFSIFSENNNTNQWKVAIYVIFWTIVIMFFTYYIIKLLIQYSPNVNKEITYEEFKQLELAPTMQNIPTKKLEELFKDRYHR